jgi:hypothetical protein
MTFNGRIPQELEELLIESISFGLEDEDVLEDTISKIDDYRMLFGSCEFVSTR